MNEEERKKVKEHPCAICGEVYLCPPHPMVKCGVSGETALDIVGLLHCLETLYEKCPNKGE